MSKRFFKTLLKKYRNNEASQKERGLVDDWYDSFSDGFPDMGKQQKKALRNELYARIKDQINPDQAQIQQRPEWIFPLKVAASILVFIAAGLTFWFLNRPYRGLAPKEEQRWTEIVAAQGKLKKVLLPDSTVVWLNAGTKIGFNAPFGQSNRRELTLAQGEAFFEVKADPDRPFIVHSGELRTQVLGTSFNVKAYAELNELRVAVLTGRVEVKGRDSTVLGLLSPGDELTYQKDIQTANIQRVVTETSNAWMSGKAYLRQASFSELALEFLHAYDIQLKAGSRTIEKQQYTMLLDRNISIEGMIKVICQIHNNQYRKEGNTITIF